MKNGPTEGFQFTFDKHSDYLDSSINLLQHDKMGDEMEEVPYLWLLELVEQHRAYKEAANNQGKNDHFLKEVLNTINLNFQDEVRFSLNGTETRRLVFPKDIRDLNGMDSTSIHDIIWTLREAKRIIRSVKEGNMILQDHITDKDGNPINKYAMVQWLEQVDFLPFDSLREVFFDTKLSDVWRIIFQISQVKSSSHNNQKLELFEELRNEIKRVKRKDSSSSHN